MKVFIYATEGQYQGLHGIYSQEVTEVRDRAEADEIGHDMAYDLIESYGLEDEYEDDEDGIESELYWSVHLIADEYADRSVEELDEICAYEDYKTFTEKYCGEELL